MCGFIMSVSSQIVKVLVSTTCEEVEPHEHMNIVYVSIVDVSNFTNFYGRCDHRAKETIILTPVIE